MSPRLIALAGVGIVALLAATGSFFTVAQNQVSVITRFGKVEATAGPGLHFKLPIVNGVETYQTDILALTTQQRVNTYTQDSQEVDVLFTVFYRIDPTRAAFIYENNQNFEQRLYSMSIDRLKVAMGQVNVQNLAERRGQLRDTIKETLTHDAAPMGISVTDFQLTDLQYTESFRDAVSKAAVQKANVEAFEYQRQQALKTAETVAVKAKGEADAAVATAKGKAEARLAEANAEAQAIRVQGEAQADAISAQSKALSTNPNLVELRRVEHWNGQLPQNIYASAPIPFFNLEARPSVVPMVVK